MQITPALEVPGSPRKESLDFQRKRTPKSKRILTLNAVFWGRIAPVFRVKGKITIGFLQIVSQVGHWDDRGV